MIITFAVQVLYQSIGERYEIKETQRVAIVFPHIRPAGIIILCRLPMRVLLENTTFLLYKVIKLQVLLELRVLFEGGAYMRKYGK